MPLGLKCQEKEKEKITRRERHWEFTECEQVKFGSRESWCKKIYF